MLTKNRIEATFERSLTVDGPVQLDIAIDNGAVLIQRGTEGAVQIRGILRARRSFLGWGDAEDRIHWMQANPPVSQNGNSIHVGFTNEWWQARGITVLFEILTPADTRVSAHTDSGDIRVRDVRGPVSCDADSGSIEISGVESDVRASADSGSIRIQQVRGSVYAEADSGSVTAFEIAGRIDAAADSGEIRLWQTEPAPVTARADSGAISLRLAPGAGYNLRIQTDSGAIHIPDLTYSREWSRQAVEGQVRGGGPLAEIRTDSGAVDVS